MENKNVVLYDAEGREIEAEPEMTTALTYNEDNLKHLEMAADGIERFVAAQIKIQNVILKLAKPGDWVIFKHGKEEVACIGGAGTERIAAALGISFIDFKANKEEDKDELGEKYIWWHTCTVVFGPRKMEVVGRFGSRNKLLGRKDKKWRPLSEIDESDIKMASRRNAMKEGVRLMLGLRTIPIEELKKAGVQLSQASYVDFDSDVKKDAKPETKPEDVKKIRDDLIKMILEIVGGDKNKAQDFLETLTTFTNDKEEIVKGKRNTVELSEKATYVAYGKCKSFYQDFLDNKEAKKEETK